MIGVVGEAVVDYLPTDDGGLVGRSGGSPANVARGLARLGRPVRLRTVIGDDDAGRLLRDSLERDGVELDPASVRPGPSSTAVATFDDLGRASYDLDVHWDPGRIALDPATDWLHTGSLATVVEPGAHEVEDLLERAAAAGVDASLDLNVRDPLPWETAETLAHLGRLAARCTVVKASDDDVALLAPGRDWRDVATTWLTPPRTALVVVTRGADGAWAATASGEVAVPGVTVPVVDTIGAGDTFMAALLDGLAATGGAVPDAPADLARVVRRACVAAALCCSRAGAEPPTCDEVDAAVAALG